MNFLDKPWPRITELSKSASRAWVAVAYLGHGAQNQLNLGDGDVLVVDMSKKALGSGQTDPREILAYLANGVRVFNWPALHAKVYVFDRTLIIGSPNVDDDEAPVIEAQARAARDRLRDQKRYEVETIRYPASTKWSVRGGDAVIQIFHDGKTVEVYPPARVLARHAYKVKRGRRVAIHLETERNPSPQPWAVVRARLHSIGFKITKTSHRELRTLAQRRHVQSLFET
ncbi:MAG: hypothetical protein IPH44_26750 [Myxococcales bacterium]|nr:hypothetical protein [Myxococcales bacterium]